MNVSLPGRCRSLLCASFAVFLVAGTLVWFPGRAVADDLNYAELFRPLAGKATGNNELTVAWTVKRDLPGKEKKGGEDAAWLVVTSSLGGKNLPPLYLEGDYAALAGMAGSEILPLVSLKDYNFDGHDDLHLAEGMSARGVYGPIHLFNPKSGGFEKSDAFSELQMVDVIPKRKRVTALYHENSCTNASREYIVRGFDTLELVFEEGTECPEDLLANDQYRSFRREYKNGTLVSEKTELHALDEDGDSDSAQIK